MPTEEYERDALVAWLGPDFLDEQEWRQKRSLAWELDLVHADGVGETP